LIIIKSFLQVLQLVNCALTPWYETDGTGKASCDSFLIRVKPA
jgi:hypothetical protein